MTNDAVQVTLKPEATFDPANAEAYLATRWRWNLPGEVSAWFATRDAAIADAAATNPGRGIG